MISYIIVSYNTAEFTLQTVESIIKNCTDFEVIVVDNDSKDDTVERLLSLNNSKLTILAQKENLGFSKANNVGFKASKGDYIVFINPDTLVRDDLGMKLKEVYKKYFSGKDVILSPRIVNPNLTNQHCTNLFPIINLSTPFKYIYKRLVSNKTLIPCDWITGVSLSMTRETADKLDGWNEAYDLYSEDLDICYRLNRKMGGKSYVVSNITLIHYGNQSGKKVYKTKYSSFKKKQDSLRTFYNIYYDDSKFKRWIKLMSIVTDNPNMKQYLKEL